MTTVSGADKNCPLLHILIQASKEIEQSFEVSKSFSVKPMTTTAFYNKQNSKKKL